MTTTLATIFFDDNTHHRSHLKNLLSLSIPLSPRWHRRQQHKITQKSSNHQSLTDQSHPTRSKTLSHCTGVLSSLWLLLVLIVRPLVDLLHSCFAFLAVDNHDAIMRDHNISLCGHQSFQIHPFHLSLFLLSPHSTSVSFLLIVSIFAFTIWFYAVSFSQIRSPFFLSQNPLFFLHTRKSLPLKL